MEISCARCGKSSYHKPRNKRKFNFCCWDCRVIFLRGENSPITKYKPTEVECLRCKKKFINLGKFQSRPRKYCSRKCSNFVGGKFIPCKMCGKDVWRIPCFYDRKFCSKNCANNFAATQRGPLNKQWKGGSKRSLYPPIFHGRLKQEIKQRDHFTCQLCCKQKNLAIHHIDYLKQNCHPTNLITLCAPCNGKVNGKKMLWISLFQTKIQLIPLLYASDL